MKVVVFDMDDTLYDEGSFVLSGFKAVADLMVHKWGVPRKSALFVMRETLARDGRGAVFDNALRHFDRFSKKNVALCVNRYRNHAPDIRLYPDARRALKRLRSYSLYVVTDGNPRVQRTKAQALGLPLQVKRVLASWHHGRNLGKPSPEIFNRIARSEGASPREVVYIGDDPNKDFVGIKPLGFKTIRIMRGRFRNLQLSRSHEADCRIETLDELTTELFDLLEMPERC